MDRLPERGPSRSRRARPELGPVIWIAVLLASWLAIAEWKMLPDLMNTTLQALL